MTHPDDTTQRTTDEGVCLSVISRKLQHFDEQGFIAAPEYGQARVILTPEPDARVRHRQPSRTGDLNTMTHRAVTQAVARADTDIQRRRLLLGAGLLAGLASVGGLAGPAHAQANLSAADRALVQQAQTYLQGLTAAQGSFVETGPNNVTRQGSFSLLRPGKMRFEYTNPAGLLVVSDGYNVKRYDPRLNSFQQVPLSRTPLSVFLARNVRLDQGVRIDSVNRMAGGAFSITARDSRRPNDGQVVLTFAGSPLRLTEWTITDVQGARTRTRLTSLQPASNLSARLFQLTDPTRRPGRN